MNKVSVVTIMSLFVVSSALRADNTPSVGGFKVKYKQPSQDPTASRVQSDFRGQATWFSRLREAKPLFKKLKRIVKRGNGSEKSKLVRSIRSLLRDLNHGAQDAWQKNLVDELYTSLSFYE